MMYRLWPDLWLSFLFTLGNLICEICYLTYHILNVEFFQQLLYFVYSTKGTEIPQVSSFPLYLLTLRHVISQSCLHLTYPLYLCVFLVESVWPQAFLIKYLLFIRSFPLRPLVFFRFNRSRSEFHFWLTVLPLYSLLRPGPASVQYFSDTWCRSDEFHTKS